MFNLVLLSGIVPTDWCIGIIKPIYKKKGSIDDPDNYRGITLLSCIGKLLTASINTRLTTYLDEASIIGEEQAGFREGYSTLDHIFALHSLVEFYLTRRKRLYCAFIDYKKAFDLVDRSSLWSKLIACGINGNVLKVIYNMYENAKSCVKQGQALSDFFSCEVGVQQGENLSPLLFAIYLNDFEYSVSRNYKGLDMLTGEIHNNLCDDDVEVFLKMYVLLYADDTIVMAETPEDLQSALNAACDYCQTWHLTVNTSKTKVIIFSRGKVRSHPDFLFGQNKLEVTDSYIYLGTNLNYNGLFNKAITKQVNQARCAMFNLTTKARKLDLHIDIQCELFDQLIMPILLYGCEIWGFQNLDQIERFHRKFLKSLLKLNRSTANCMVYGEVGRQNVTAVIEKRMINFWIHIIDGKQSKLSNVIFRLMKSLHDTGDFKSKWILKIKSIIDGCGLTNMWHDHSIVNIKWLKHNLELKLKDINIQTWHSEIHANRLCSNYRIFKNEVGFEKYLTYLSPTDRINLCKFRCGNHKLPISVGRYLPGNAQRLCHLCNTGDQGDEYHYVLVCPSLMEERSKYIKRYFRIRPNTLKMNQLFNVHNVKQLTDLSRFIKIMTKFV